KGRSETYAADVQDARAARDATGTNVRIVFNPTSWPIVPVADELNPRQPTPPYIVLGHEMGHAIHAEQGTAKTGVTEETRTIRQFENPLRRDLGRPDRLRDTILSQ